MGVASFQYFLQIFDLVVNPSLSIAFTLAIFFIPLFFELDTLGLD